MNTIGQIIKIARIEKGYSLQVVENETKIKGGFIRAIEEEEWEYLPEFPVVQGFVKNIANFLGLNEDKMVATLRRDYPPKVVPINPKPDVSKKLTWSPKWTFVIGVLTVIIVISGYLLYQYSDFVSPPSLEVMRPGEGEIVESQVVTVVGTTDPDITLIVNNQPVIVDESGSFSVELDVSEGTNELVIKASSRSGKETVVHRRISVKVED